MTNAYARSNVQEFSYDASRNYARQEENFLPITPTLGVTATFSAGTETPASLAAVQVCAWVVESIGVEPMTS